MQIGHLCGCILYSVVCVFSVVTNTTIPNTFKRMCLLYYLWRCFVCVCVYPDPDRVGTSNNRPPASDIRNSFNVVSAGRQRSTHLKYESQFKQNGPAKTFIGDGQSTCNAMLHLQYGPYRMVPRQNFQRFWDMCPWKLHRKWNFKKIIEQKLKWFVRRIVLLHFSHFSQIYSPAISRNANIASVSISFGCTWREVRAEGKRASRLVSKRLDKNCIACICAFVCFFSAKRRLYIPYTRRSRKKQTVFSRTLLI